MKVVLLMANNTASPYFTRFANLYDKSQGIELSFVCLFPTLPDMVKEMNGKGITCHWIKYDYNKRKTHMISVVFKLFFLFKKIKPDVVHTHLFDDSLPGLIAARMAGVKKRIISKLDAGFHYANQPSLLKFDRFNNLNATDIITVSGENKNFVIDIEKTKKNKIHLIHQGVFIDEVTSISIKKQNDLIKKYQLENKKVILSVSRYIEWKGYRYIVEAAEKVIKKYPETVFLFVGYGEQKATLENLVAEKNLSNHIIFTDWIGREELNNIYQIANIFVHAAINEPFGFVLAEAMMNKIPIVTTKTGCAYDSVEHLKSGYLTEFKNANQIADGIFYLLENDTTPMVTTAYEKAINLFTAEKMWQKHINLYKL